MSTAGLGSLAFLVDCGSQLSSIGADCGPGVSGMLADRGEMLKEICFRGAIAEIVDGAQVFQLGVEAGFQSRRRRETRRAQAAGL